MDAKLWTIVHVLGPKGSTEVMNDQQKYQNKEKKNIVIGEGDELVGREVFSVW